MSHSLFENAEILSMYTRAQAIEDGVLVDMTAEPFGDLAREAGLKWPITMTSTAFHAFVAVSDTKGHSCQDIKGRWWDVVWMFRRTRREISPLEARWSVCVRDPDGRVRQKQLKCVSGPADDGEPCLTFMLPDED
ncbi:DUF6573 family protein [Edaphobacter modestus]|uniref:Uncharacterized protein n=1 Tax=Edaphobacter modestus TaxID=388466 RepID=A0A4Q7XZN8_9BACT|nr:DUF6573 family protein [Edaphobacter modestus]RZU28895.1 hypothetical protein BDD14_6478 [Edaphobacter modestus]